VLRNSVNPWLKYWLIFLAFVGLLHLIFFLSITLGSVSIALGEVARILLEGPAGKGVNTDVIWEIRLPRALGAIFGGASLATSGLLLQVFFRNPIVEPYVLGISSGATLMVAVTMLTSLSLGMTRFSPLFLSGAALTGALGVMLLVIILAARVQNVITLLVTGLMMGYLCSAITTILVALAEKERLHGFVLWTLGSFSGFTWQQVYLLVMVAVPLLAFSFFLGKPLNAFLLGENYARSMGVSIRALRVAIVVLASSLTGAVTAFAGPVAFIGLAVPHLARLLLGSSDNRILLPAVVLLGAVVTSLCDLLARSILSPVELPVSALTSFFGAPLIVSLLLKRRTAL